MSRVELDILGFISRAQNRHKSTKPVTLLQTGCHTAEELGSLCKHLIILM